MQIEDYGSLWENPMYIKYHKSSELVSDHLKVDLESWDSCKEKILPSLNKQTKIHLDVFYKNASLALCGIYRVLNIQQRR